MQLNRNLLIPPQEAIIALEVAAQTAGGRFVQQRGLKPEFYDTAVSVAVDRRRSRYTERLMLLAPGLKVYGKIPNHVHGLMAEEFTILEAFGENPRGFLTGEHRDIPLSVGMEAQSTPGQVHGFRIESGFFLVKVIIRNFDRKDIFSPDAYRRRRFAASFVSRIRYNKKPICHKGRKFMPVGASRVAA